MTAAILSNSIECPRKASIAKRTIFFSGYFVSPQIGLTIIFIRHLLKAEPSDHATNKAIALWHLHDQISDAARHQAKIASVDGNVDIRGTSQAGDRIGKPLLS